MNATEFARNEVTDDIIVAALNRNWKFTFQVLVAVTGKQIKSVIPNYRKRLRRLERAGRIISDPFCNAILGQERWRLPYNREELAAQALAGEHYDAENLIDKVVFLRDEWVHRNWQDFMPGPVTVTDADAAPGKSFRTIAQLEDGFGTESGLVIRKHGGAVFVEHES